MAYHFFWGGPFSNWAIGTFTVDGVVYNCVEQYMMVKKAEVFNDDHIRSKILASIDPRNQKALGRKVKGFTDERWDEVKYDIVFKGCYAKFTQIERFKKFMLETGDDHIVEASPYDKVWGIGMGEDHPDRFDESKWKGENLLGKVLMDVRERIRNEDSGNE